MGMYFPTKKGWTFDADRDTGIDCSKDEPMTQQQFIEDCDVNIIIARCLKTGFLPDMGSVRGAFADVSAIGEFGDLQQRIAAANEAFMELPANVRTKFDNDPGKLIAFVADEANRAEAEKLGLIEPRKEVKKESAPAPVVPDVKG